VSRSLHQRESRGLPAEETAAGHRPALHGLSGHLELTCSADGIGQSILRHQSFSAPFHIGKSYWDGHSLRVQVVNPTAGLLAGDTTRLNIRVERGAALQITTPSASRVHTMNQGQATVDQSFHVATGGWLEFNPSPLIPQARSRCRQITRINVEQGGEAFFLETLVPGRVARGEVFQFDEVDWCCDVRFAGRLVSRERFKLRPDDASLWALKHPFPVGYYASGCVLTERPLHENGCIETLRQLNSDPLWLGINALAQGGWSLRLLAADSLAMQAAKRSVREILSGFFPQLGSEPRT
jgi:urease accessory protein